MKWSSDALDHIRSAHDIVEWISRDTVLKAGAQGQYTGLCPFPDHNEKTPSFSVSSVKQVYHCFGCQKGGDIFTYLRDHKGMGFVSAVQYLAQQAGITLQTDNGREHAENSEKLNLFKIHEQAVEVFHQELLKTPTGHLVRKYLNKRGYSQEMIQKFRLGYAPAKGCLLNVLKSSRQKERLKKAGLVIQKSTTEFEFFRSRLIFPIFSTMNQVLGFGARSLDQSMPKYINSRDSLCFQKGRILYGLNESAPYIRKAGHVFIVEGYTDFLTLFQNGFTNTAAVLGAALTEHHARLLRRYTDKAVLFFDGDPAGGQAALRSLPVLLKYGLRVHQVELKGMDPDECIRNKGKAFLKQMMSKNYDLFLHIFSKNWENKRGAERLDLFRKMLGVLSEMQDKVLKEYYIQSMMDMFTLSDQKSVQMIVDQEVHKTQKNLSSKPLKKSTGASNEKNFRVSLESLTRPELYLLVLSLHEESYLKFICRHLDTRQITHAGLQGVFDIIFKNYDENPADFDKLLAQAMMKVEPEGGLCVQKYPNLKALNLDSGRKMIQDCLSCLKLNYENSKIKTLTMQLKLKQEDREKKYLKEIMKIKKISMENPNEKQN